MKRFLSPPDLSLVSAAVAFGGVFFVFGWMMQECIMDSFKIELLKLSMREVYGLAYAR